MQELFHENNQFSLNAINELNRILVEENDQIRTENISNDKFNNGGSSYSLPDEEMLKRYYSYRNTSN